MLIKEEKETFSLSSSSSLRASEERKGYLEEGFSGEREKLCCVFLFSKNDRPFAIWDRLGTRSTEIERISEERYTHTHTRVNEARFGFRV